MTMLLWALAAMLTGSLITLICWYLGQRLGTRFIEHGDKRYLCDDIKGAAHDR